MLDRLAKLLLRTRGSPHDDSVQIVLCEEFIKDGILRRGTNASWELAVGAELEHALLADQSMMGMGELNQQGAVAEIQGMRWLY